MRKRTSQKNSLIVGFQSFAECFLPFDTVLGKGIKIHSCAAQSLDIHLIDDYRFIKGEIVFSPDNLWKVEWMNVQ